MDFSFIGVGTIVRGMVEDICILLVDAWFQSKKVQSS